MKRFRLLVASMVCVFFVGLVFGGATASARTYVASCSNTSFLEFKPDYWSSGCTGGSVNVQPVTWSRWSARSAKGRGVVLANDCDPSCAGGSIYRYRTTVRLYHPRTCHGNGRHRYFSKSRLNVTFRRGNPYGYPAGQKILRFPVYGGTCSVTR